MSRLLFFTGLRVPLVGRAPRDGFKLIKRLAREYPSANLTCHSWREAIDANTLLSEAPLVLMGHSFGGSTAIWLAHELKKHNKPVDEMLLLDPVPTQLAARWTTSVIDVPENVKQTACIIRQSRPYPRSKPARGLNVANEVCSIAHDDFLRKTEIVERIERLVRQYATSTVS